jgi:hypothetical protein
MKADPRGQNFLIITPIEVKIGNRFDALRPLGFVG